MKSSFKISLNFLLIFIFWAFLLTSLNAQVKDADGNVYSTTKIGNQEWLTQNLAATKFRNGTPIQLASSFEDWKKYNLAKIPAYCYYQFDPVYGLEYGIIYNFYAVSDSRGIAPKGFHIPSTIEWEKLFIQLDGDSLAIPKIITKNKWDDKIFTSISDSSNELSENSNFKIIKVNNCSGNNSTKFSAIPTLGMADKREQDMLRYTTVELGGELIDNLEFDDEAITFTSSTAWWSSTQFDTEKAWIRKLYACSAKSIRSTYEKYFGLYVRCIRDQKE